MQLTSISETSSKDVSEELENKDTLNTYYSLFIVIILTLLYRVSLSFVQKEEGMCSCIITPIGSKQWLLNRKLSILSSYPLFLCLPAFQAVVILVMQSTCIYAVSAYFPNIEVLLLLNFLICDVAYQFHKSA